MHRLGLGLGFRCGSDRGARLWRWCWWWRRLETRCSLGRPLPDLCLTLHVTVRRLRTGVFPGVLSAYFPILLSLAQDGAVGIHKNVVGLFYRARYGRRLLDDFPLSDSPVNRISCSRHVGFASRLASRFRREYFITLYFFVHLRSLSPPLPRWVFCSWCRSDRHRCRRGKRSHSRTPDSGWPLVVQCPSTRRTGIPPSAGGRRRSCRSPMNGTVNRMVPTTVDRSGSRTIQRTVSGRPPPSRSLTP